MNDGYIKEKVQKPSRTVCRRFYGTNTQVIVGKERGEVLISVSMKTW